MSGDTSSIGLRDVSERVHEELRRYRIAITEDVWRELITLEGDADSAVETLAENYAWELFSRRDFDCFNSGPGDEYPCALVVTREYDTEMNNFVVVIRLRS